MLYHFERSRPDASYADYILNPNIGRTLESIKQAVSDGRKLIQWLKYEATIGVKSLNRMTRIGRAVYERVS